MLDHIDYSQLSKWQFCPWAWYEKYILKRSKKWPEGRLRDDALAIGSLTHNGLDNWYAKASPDIDEATIARINPDPNTLRMCRRLVHGYVQTFPKEEWELIKTEQPIRFKLVEGKDGLAKIDLYFYIPDTRHVESGIPGYEITLNPGWWIQEYKTKSPHVPTADWMKQWSTNPQVDFQMLALKHYLETEGYPEYRGEAGGPINGVLVNVIEKPKDYIPKRKCQKCEEYYAYSAWVVGSGNAFYCPVCGNSQRLKPLEVRGEEAEPRYFRVIVERTEEQLKKSQCDIQMIATEMQRVERAMKEDQNYIQLDLGDVITPNKDNCFNLKFRYAKECEYYWPHLLGQSTIGHPDFEESEDYVREGN